MTTIAGILGDDTHDIELTLNSGSTHDGQKYQAVTTFDIAEFTLGPPPKAANQDDVDLEAGQEEEEEPALMDWAETMATVDVGCWARTKTGTAGISADEDSFPWLQHSPMSFIRILWDLSPSDYRYGEPLTHCYLNC